MDARLCLRASAEVGKPNAANRQLEATLKLLVILVVLRQKVGIAGVKVQGEARLRK